MRKWRAGIPSLAQRLSISARVSCGPDTTQSDGALIDATAQQPLSQPHTRSTGARTDSSSAYVLDLFWRGAPASVGEARAAVFALIGSFAESATYVRQRRVPGGGDVAAAALQFEVGTGELGSDARFGPHGHVVVINLAGDIGAPAGGG